MIRSSTISRILSHRIQDKSFELSDKINEIKKKDRNFKTDDVHLYTKRRGYMKLAKEVEKLLENQILYGTQPLPPGGMNYLQTLWLQNEMGFPPVGEDSFSYPLFKGTVMEDHAISLLGSEYKKNEEHVVKGFLSGTADLVLSDQIWDVKIPKDWESFRDKKELPLAYYWQVVCYCYLYNKPSGRVVYILTEHPVDSPELSEVTSSQLEAMKEENKIISKLSVSQRIKSFDVTFSKQDINFMLNRVDQAEKYYKSLTYDRCMKMNV